MRRSLPPLICLALAGCDPASLSLGAPSAKLPVGVAAVVPIERIVNELKCDYLDWERSPLHDHKRLLIGDVHGKLTLSASRADTQGGGIGVAVASGPIKVSIGASTSVESRAENALEIPFRMTGAAPGPVAPLEPPIDCSPERRLNSPIIGIRALGEGLARAQAGRPYFRIGDALHFKGQFYLKRHSEAGGSIDVVLIKVDPAKVVADGIYIQSFDITVDAAGAFFLHPSARDLIEHDDAVTYLRTPRRR